MDDIPKTVKVEGSGWRGEWARDSHKEKER